MRTHHRTQRRFPAPGAPALDTPRRRPLPTSASGVYRARRLRDAPVAALVIP